jgi:undecaprenyl diphosphate synthase
MEEGYAHAMDNLFRLLSFAFERAVCSLSVYMSSAQNFRRSSAQIEAFCSAEAAACETLLPGLVRRFDARVSIVGNVSRLPEYFRRVLDNIPGKQLSTATRRLNLCFAYDPFDEIEHALQQRKESNCLANYLWISQPLDLVIRTGSANLISNFLPLQAGFARLYFSDKMFNDFTVNDFDQVLDSFAGEERLYGE